MKIKLIAAVSMNNVIGKGGKLPWHLPSDLQRFKELTTNHIVVMGRRTWESLPEKYRPLPERLNIVVSSTNPGSLAMWAKSYEEAVDWCRDGGEKDLWVIGGQQLYAAALAGRGRYAVDEIHQTRVNLHVDGGDAFMPEIDRTRYRYRFVDTRFTEKESRIESLYVVFERIPAKPLAEAIADAITALDDAEAHEEAQNLDVAWKTHLENEKQDG